MVFSIELEMDFGRTGIVRLTFSLLYFEVATIARRSRKRSWKEKQETANFLFTCLDAEGVAGRLVSSGQRHWFSI
jgi:hypothetical protein